MANGDVATRTSAPAATALPPRRRPASQMNGNVAQLSTPDSERTPSSDVPKASHPEMEEVVVERRRAVAAQGAVDLPEGQPGDVERQRFVEPHVGASHEAQDDAEHHRHDRRRHEQEPVRPGRRSRDRRRRRRARTPRRRTPRDRGRRAGAALRRRVDGRRSSDATVGALTGGASSGGASMRWYPPVASRRRRLGPSIGRMVTNGDVRPAAARTCARTPARRAFADPRSWPAAPGRDPTRCPSATHRRRDGRCARRRRRRRPPPRRGGRRGGRGRGTWPRRARGRGPRPARAWRAKNGGVVARRHRGPRRRVVGDGLGSEEQTRRAAPPPGPARRSPPRRWPPSSASSQARGPRAQRRRSRAGCTASSTARPGRGGERVPRQGARLVDGPVRGQHVEDVAPAPEGAHGEPAADDLAEAPQVGRHPEAWPTSPRRRPGTR